MTTAQVTLDDGREFSVEVAFACWELPTPDSPGQGPDMEITAIFDEEGQDVLKSLDRATFDQIDNLVQGMYLELQVAAINEADMRQRLEDDYDWS